MKKLNLLLIAFLCSFAVLAQDEEAAPAEGEDAEPTGPWTRTTVLGINGSQTYLDNWQGGGQSAINGTALFNATFNYKKNRWTWDNTFDAAYGLTRIGDDTKEFQKTDDRVELNSKVGRAWKYEKISWTGQFTFRTQWDAGYDYSLDPAPLISDPFSPAYVIAGLGLDYKPKEGLSIYLSPITNKTTIVDNQRLADQGAFGVTAAEFDPVTGEKIKDGETVRYEVGGFLKLEYTQTIMENVKFTTKADFFSNYIEDPQNIDVNWETLLAMKINEYLSASITTHLIYDHDIKFDVDRDDDGVIDGTGPRTQFKEVFSLGIQYQF